MRDSDFKSKINIGFFPASGGCIVEQVKCFRFLRDGMHFALHRTYLYSPLLGRITLMPGYTISEVSTGLAVTEPTRTREGAYIKLDAIFATYGTTAVAYFVRTRDKLNKIHGDDSSAVD